MTQLNHSKSTKAGWINAVLIPVKQHVICCGLVPMIASMGGGSVAAALESTTGEIAMAVIVPPLVTYGVMWAEQTINHRRHAPDSCACDHPKTLTLKNYFRQTALAYGFYAAAHFLLPHKEHVAPPAREPMPQHSIPPRAEPVSCN